ncbi:MAG: HlyD family efflux transporter periplasmic adaptor subunit [Pseudomonadota bacterium]
MSHTAPPTPSTDAAPAAPIRPLFRQQAVAHVSTKQYGTVILARSVPHQVLTGLFLVIAAGIIGFFTFFGTTRKAQCQGVLLPTAGVIRILPSQAGVIMEKRVKEGQAVHAGDVLFVLSSERSSASADAPQKTVSKLLQQRRDSFDTELRQSTMQSRQRVAASAHRADELKADVERIDKQIGMQQKRVALAEQAQKRFQELHATNYISAAQLQEKEGELLDQRQRLADLVRAQAASARDLASAQADMRDLQVQAQRDIGALQRNVSALEQDLTENEARREIVVRAPQDGMVTAIATEVGQTVGASVTLASLLPAGAELEAEVYAPSRSAGFIKPGMTVLLRYQAYPYQKFGQYAAQVREVANTAMRADELAIPGAASATPSEPLYRIRLRLDRQAVQAYGKAMPLKSGMLVDASVMLERRRLYEWILEPLFSISGRL